MGWGSRSKVLGVLWKVGVVFPIFSHINWNAHNFSFIKANKFIFGHKLDIITRNNWNTIKDIKDSIIFNCTPVENIEVDDSNDFIDCIVSTPSGKRLSWLQASHQFKLYTNEELTIGTI